MNISYFPNLHHWLPLSENLATVKLSCLRHSVRDFLFSLFLEKFHALDKQIQHLINLSFFMMIVAGFFSSTHFANIWHVDKTEVVTFPFEKKHLLNDFFNLLYLKFWSENIFKTRLVSSEKYKPSFLS